MTTTNSIPRDAAAVVGEAARDAAEAARRTIEGMQAATQVGRSYWDESAALGRRLFTAYVAATEATLKATFEAQKAALAAGNTVLTSAATSGQSATQEWTAAVRQTQQITLDLFNLGVRTCEEVFLGTPRA
jgi:hypothetical protein